MKESDDSKENVPSSHSKGFLSIFMHQKQQLTSPTLSAVKQAVEDDNRAMDSPLEDENQERTAEPPSCEHDQSKLSSTTAWGGTMVSSPSAQRRKSILSGIGIRRLSLALLLAVLVCISWTIWLIILTVSPNETINHIMQTERYDEGSFWLLIEPPSSILWLGVIGLAIVVIGYLYVIFKMTYWHKQIHQAASRTRSSSFQSKVTTFSKNFKKAVEEAAKDERRGSMKQKTAKAVVNLTQKDTLTRKFANVSIKLVDLAVQVVLLVQILEAGSPLFLVGIFTAIVTLNSLTCAILIYLPKEASGLTVALIDTTFDMLIAIIYPMILVIYCLKNFTFDRALFKLKEEVFYWGASERSARVNSDPVEVEIITKALNSLRISSALAFFTRVGTNLALCHRFSHIVDIVHQPSKYKSNPYPRKHPIALVFVLFSLMMVVFVEESIRTSRDACAPHPECAIQAFRWTIRKDGDLSQCPCIALIDEDSHIKLYADWLQPKNMTDKVRYLSMPGYLQTLRLVNRQLPVYPEELRRCKNLKHMSLLYTHTTTLPSWFKEFTKLEYLHIEGKALVSALEYLPDDLFEQMEWLTFIHLAVHPSLKHFPSFNGLKNLRSLTLAMLVQLEELQPFDDLHNLERLEFGFLPYVDNIPDMTPIKNLKSLVFAGRGAMCCNGFLETGCDLQNGLCQANPIYGVPEATCLAANRTDKIATKATLKAFAKFHESVCDPTPWPLDWFHDEPSGPNMAMCNGTMYRHCVMAGNRTGMCFNPRMMPITCDGNIQAIEMRRKEIERGLGVPCNPSYEAWLGCK